MGTGRPTAFSPDGDRLLVEWSTADAPSDVWVVDAATGAVAPLRPEPRPTLDGLAPIRSSVVTIPGFDGLPIPTNVHLPTDREKVPVIVRFHGGPAGAAAVDWSPIARFFLARGYGWVEPNIRGSAGFGRKFQAADDGGKRPDSFRDLESVAAWIAEQPWTDGTLVAYGNSYGGYLVLIALTRQPVWDAGVDLYGLADLETFMASTSGLVRQNYRTELGDPEKDAEFLRSISPIRQVDAIRSPLFVYAGQNDPRVPIAQSDALVEALRTRSVPVQYMRAVDEGHGISRRENLIALLVRVGAFLDRYRTSAPPVVAEGAPATLQQ